MLIFPVTVGRQNKPCNSVTMWIFQRFLSFADSSGMQASESEIQRLLEKSEEIRKRSDALAAAASEQEARLLALMRRFRELGTILQPLRG